MSCFCKQLPPSEGAERRSRRGGRPKLDGGCDGGAASEERWRQTAIKARGRNKRDGGGDRDEAAEERKAAEEPGTETGLRHGGKKNATEAATEVRRPMRLRTERRSRRVGKKNAAAAATELRRLSFINNHNLKSSHAQHDSEMVSSSRRVDSAATVCANAVSSPPGLKAAVGHATPLLLD